ncbi:MAG: acetylglutamate kinase [Alphaproteobacteria bacterium]|nr:acetylglutamate kinase [Alphaproteobacteria bacterium]
MTKESPSLYHIAEMMDELAAYAGQTVVIKIGGNSIDEDPDFLGALAAQLAFLQSRHVRIVLVHGGGPQIDRALAAEGLAVAKGPDGRRLTSPAMMAVVARTMGEISESIAAELENAGCAVFTAALAGGRFVKARPLLKDSPGDRTGMPDSVDARRLGRHLEKGEIVLLNSVGEGPDGHDANINADDFAMAVAMALKARRLVLATNVAGVCSADKNLITRLTPEDAHGLIKSGVITGGMIPKVESALNALESGVGGVVIIDAHQRWALLGELMTRKGFGTLITAA